MRKKPGSKEDRNRFETNVFYSKSCLCLNHQLESVNTMFSLAILVTFKSETT